MFANFSTTLFAAIALAIAAPALASEVNVYSYRQPELVKPLMDRFTDLTGIKVNIAFLQSGLNERLAAEGSRTPADLIFTTDISRLNGAVVAGHTQAVTSATLSANIPAKYRDPDGHWFGLTARVRLIYASRDRVAEGAVTSYDDLADPRWRGRICTRSGTHPYTVALVSAAIAHMGEADAKIWLTAVKGNLGRKPQGNDRAQVKAIWAGQCDISLGNNYYYGKMLAKEEQVVWAESVNLVFPVFEGGGTHENISGMALTKHAPHREDAILLMEFLASPEAQTIYAQQNFEYPIAPNTSPTEQVQSWGSYLADTIGLIEVANLRSTALKMIEEVDFDG